MSKYKRGFNLIEIILAIGIATIVFVAVFEFVATTSVYSPQNVYANNYNLSLYRYNEKLCTVPTNMGGVLRIQSQNHLNFISTSTPVTSMYMLDDNLMVLTTDSSSTTEPDVFVMDVVTLEIKGSFDIGPGVQDSIILGDYIYLANTSINSHIKVLHLNIGLSELVTFTEVQNIKIFTLSQSGAMPRTLNMYGDILLLGSEKNVAGGELFLMQIQKDGLLSSPVSIIELGGQAHRATVFKDLLLITNSGDPELYLYKNYSTQMISYDAPLTLGNGKSVIGLYPYIIFGRTLGSGELSLLKYITDEQILVESTHRTNGTVDFLQWIDQDSVNPTFFAFTANTTKEFQLWSIQDNKFVLINSLDLPARATAYLCRAQTMVVAMNINNIATLVWLVQ